MASKYAEVAKWVMWKPIAFPLGSLLFAALIGSPSWAANQVSPANNVLSGGPGTLNYVEGNALIGSETLSSKSVGSARLGAGETLTTQSGRAEVLLAPGIVMRIGDNSSITMVSPDLVNTELRLNTGRAMVEVDHIYKENNMRIDQDDASTKLEKTGLYEFDANAGQVRVFRGKAEVFEGSKK